MLKSFLFIILLNNQIENDTIPLIDSNVILEKIEDLNKNEAYSSTISLLEQVTPYDSNYLEVQRKLIEAYALHGLFDKAKELGRSLMSERTDLSADFYVTLGNQYLNNDLLLEGIEIYEKGLESYPYNTSLLYNTGYSEYMLGNYDESISIMIDVLKINPYYSRAHQMLGNIMCKTKQRTKAVLSYLAYLAMNTDQNWALVRLNDLLSDGYREEGTIDVDLDNSDFEYYDQLLRSKAALDDRFESEVDLEVPVAQQVELLMKKLKYNQESEDFWMKFYVPFLVSISNEELTDAFVYFMLYSSKNEGVIAWIEKNIKEKEQWIKLVQNHLDQFKLVHQRTILDTDDDYNHWYYNTGALSAIGNEYAKNNVGPYEFYHPNGRLKAQGVYNREGQKIGTWRYYHENGQLSTAERYTDGKVEGVIDFYKEDGKLKSSGDYTDGELDGYWTWYYPCGVMSEEYPYVNGVGNGDGKIYYETGEIKKTYTVVDGNKNGSYVLYYKNGKVSNEYQYDKDVLEGDYKSYHPDSSLAEVGQFKNDQKDGNWKSYYFNGNIESTGSYQTGNKIGRWEYSYPNGNLMRSEHYNETGDLHGLTTWYDVDGKIHSERTLDRGMIVEYRFFNKEGIVIFDQANESGNMVYKGYYASGDLFAEGTLENGKLNGAYKTYHYNGQTLFEGTMKDDDWDGALVEYYKSGIVKTINNYRDGQLSGYYRAYHENGEIKNEGWLKEGEIQQRWVEYYLNGSIESDGLYTNGSPHEIKYYDTQGRIYALEYFEDRLFSRFQQYDTLGNMYNEQIIPIKEANYSLISPSGQVTLSKTKNCGVDVGETRFYVQGQTVAHYAFKNSELDRYTGYNLKGQITVEGSYLNDERHGTWNYYYDDGQLDYSANYVIGKREEKSVSYYQNGNIEMECERYQNDRNGPCKYYDPQGELQVIKYYVPDYGVYGYQYKLEGGAFSDTLAIDRKGIFELKAYFSNGKPSVIQRYSNGYYHGESFFYSSNGRIQNRLNFRNGLSHGTDEEYYPDGQLKHVESFYYGENHGPEKYFYKNGQLKEVLNWSYGSKYGWNRMYDENGQLLTEIFFRNDTEY